MSNTLVVGPYIGEFGYELFKWQGYVRTQAKLYDKVIVSSRPGHAVIYKDFAQNYISYTTPVSACAGIANTIEESDIYEVASQVFKGIPYNRIIVPFKLEPNTPQEYTPYGHNNNNYVPYDIVIHARNITVNSGNMRTKDRTLKESRNWSYANWWHFITYINQRSKLRICCIGHPDAALYLDNTDDKRNIELAELADLLANAKVIVGPSSGPMHFATLCRCPQVVWGTPNLLKRYQTEWNPLGTPVEFISTDEHWNPDPTYVAELTIRTISL